MATGILLLAIICWGFEHTYPSTESPAAVSAAKIANQRSSTAAISTSDKIVVTYFDGKASHSYEARGVPEAITISSEGTSKIQVGKIAVSSVSDGLSFKEQFKGWGKNLIGQTVFVWNQILGILGSLTLLISVLVKPVKSTGAKVTFPHKSNGGSRSNPIL
jgi:hypothetical protein